MTLQERIRRRMDAANLNDYSAAKKAGLGDSFVRDIMRGKVKNPSAAKLAKLAKALDCGLWDLIEMPDRQSGASQEMTVQDRIQARMAELGLTAITAATRADLPRDTIRNLLRSPGSSPTLATLERIAAALDCTPGDLAGYSSTPPEASQARIERKLDALLAHLGVNLTATKAEQPPA